MQRRIHQVGFTLVELMIAIGVLAMVCTLIYGALASMKNAREGVRRVNDRYREGRLAISRISRDLQCAYISAHAPFDQSLMVVKTAFIGQRSSPAARLDFNSFSNYRLDRDSHESDQAELSYFGSPNPEQQGVTDLARRISTLLDMQPQRGGRVEVLATDIDLFDLSYLDPMTGEWVETWDTTQATGQLSRLPLQVRVLLVLNGGERKRRDRGREAVRLIAKVTLPIQNALTFATQ
jgi:general secretion pathway protein J